ncbi:unnamed protein product (macronuclear) [Paramecium tetraurelia]|uniref:Chromosome undetermined scaffold_1, whole genome shotgun sequence n=1 Tax=Paramecium tetraurelia TaxID=5888 RepID=Q6BFW9_PARTE|nr:RAS-related GTP-binding protein [Paramecium tetraurelia strain d4-2]XP_001423225.1 uncharacterized protein GSPATT00000262001 [Paramecium tetraurelia]CAH03451.1 RAS-related GTP-binding protein, putative [Paramecium tetraurelia]CAI39289.1 rag_C75 [Paramecium tetraurelia]CAK55827.1 unnamed protein product [Paramecium tetraurelia]|eukprot:XP_001423225.1 hypothetical protein (macronuclear) [Paramecium tetraurelia strain d4-2]
MFNNTENQLKKLLLMGQQKSGKSSMHKVIFACAPIKELQQIGVTTNVSKINVRFMGNLHIDLLDIPGQPEEQKKYLFDLKETIFSTVEVLVYLFDVETEGEQFNSELITYKTTLSNLSEYSPGSKVFVLINKFDKIKESDRKMVFERKYKKIIQDSEGFNIEVKEIFATCIWDETLYKAWSQIVQNLIPDRDIIHNSLKTFCTKCSCDEVVLFEKQSYLVIDFVDVNEKKDILKYERISNIIKQFKLSCKMAQIDIQTIMVKSQKFNVQIVEFTDNTFILLLFTDEKVYPAAIQHNVQYAKKLFKSINGSETDKLKLLL